MSRVVRLGKVSLTFDMLTTAQKQELTGPIGPIGPQGKQGIQGASLILKNDWVSGTAYKNDTTGIDTVSYQGCYYGCKKSHTASASITPTNTTYWMLLAAKGSQGIQGIQGVKGVDGDKLLFGAGEPAAATGKQGDAYLNTSNWDVFSKTSATTWTRQGNIKGKDGNAKVADNYTTIDPTYALSAPKGKELHEHISKIGNLSGIINGDFRVWQRGDSFSNFANEYTADRWLVMQTGASSTTVSKSTDVPMGMPFVNSLKIVETTNLNANLWYLFEEPLKSGVTYTVSFWVKTESDIESRVLPTTGGTGIDKTFQSAGNEWDLKIWTFTPQNDMRGISVLNRFKGTAYITGVKYDVGEITTPYIPRPYAEELMLCQRDFMYYEEITSDVHTHYINKQNDAVVGEIYLPSCLRIKPTVNCSGITIRSINTSNSYNGKIHASRLNGNILYITIKRTDDSVLPLTTDGGYILVLSGLSIDAEIY